MFAGQYLLHLRLVQVRMRALEPVRQPLRNFQRLGVTGQAVGVAQPREHLVLGVVGDPDAVQVETGGADVSGGDFRVRLFAIRYRREVARPARLLALGEFIDKVVDAVQELPVAGGGPGNRARAQVVPPAMAGDALRFPAAVMLRLGLKPGLFPEIRQQPVRLQAQQVFDRDRLSFLEGPVEQADIVQAERRGLRRGGKFDLCLGAQPQAERQRQRGNYQTSHHGKLDANLTKSFDPAKAFRRALLQPS